MYKIKEEAAGGNIINIGGSLLDELAVDINENKFNEKEFISFRTNLNNEKIEFKKLKASIRSKKPFFIIKRVFDLMSSAAMLIFLSPVILFVSLMIKLSSRGHIFFKQKRIGYLGKKFTMYKFRSMKTCKNNNVNQTTGILDKSNNDPRVTWIGKIIRKTSIDELPQLINVFLGDMSLIGPRPLIPQMLAPYKEYKISRSLVKPGITGLWQIRDRQNNKSVLQMIRHDMEYIENISFKSDLQIILYTLPAVLKGEGAV